MLVQGGTADLFITMALEQGGAFAAIPTPACKVVYEKADHFAPTDHRADFQAVTAAATVAFLDHAFAKRSLNQAALVSPQAARVECK